MDVNAALNEYNTAQAEYKKFAEGESSFGSTLRSSIQKQLQDNQDLIAQVAGGEEGYYNAPSVAREKYQSVFNPFQKEALVSEYTGQARQGWTVPQGLLEQRMGTTENIVGKAVEGYKTDISNKQSIAQQAWAAYQQAVSEQQHAEELAASERASIRSSSSSGSSKKATTADYRQELGNDINDSFNYFDSNKMNAPQGWTESALLPELYSIYMPKGIKKDDIDNMVYTLRKPYEARGTF